MPRSKGPRRRKGRTTASRSNPLATQAEKLLHALPDRPAPSRVPLPVMAGGFAQAGWATVSPGWSGQCPVLFTKDYSVVVFLPPDLFHTLYEALRQPGGPKVSLKACTNAVGPEIVTAIYERG